MRSGETLIPVLGVVTEIRRETPDVKTFRVSAPGGGAVFPHMPGQCAMLSIPGVGEAMFSITTSPTTKAYMEFSIKQTGLLTDWLHGMEPGQQVAIRGPYGNAFPLETELKGKDLLFIAGGIGLAPLRAVILYVRHYRDNYGKVDLVYGARSKEDLVFYEEVSKDWASSEDMQVHLTIDRAQEGWEGNVGFVPDFVRSLDFSPKCSTLVCGPPIMIKLTLDALWGMGFDRTKTFTTMELKMKCGVGKCGRCNIGSKYVCKDGPVFRCDELAELPDEY
ncbi:MAG: FAD/NAD(P)-binding protein [Clostridiales bacterium]|nr:FAD/NAD(P)-binding protein [Clostridiales bacterium]